MRYDIVVKWSKRVFANDTTELNEIQEKSQKKIIRKNSDRREYDIL